MDTVVWILITTAIIFPAIVFAGLYRVRVRNFPAPRLSLPRTENSMDQPVALDLTLPLLTQLEGRIRRMKLAPMFGFFVSGGPIWLAVLLNGDRKIILDPNQPFLKFLIPITVALALISFYVAKAASRDNIKAYFISKGRRLIFEISVSGLRIPTLLLTYQAFRHLIRREQAEVFIPWSDIEKLQIFPEMGRSPSQYTIIPRGQTLELGSRFGIKRCPLIDHEDEIVAQLTRFLPGKLELRDALLGGKSVPSSKKPEEEIL